MGDGRAEGLPTVGDGGQAALWLTSGVDGTGFGSINHGQAHVPVRLDVKSCMVISGKELIKTG